MKKMLRSYLHSLAIAGVLLVTTFSARASHIVGADLTYKWTGGLTYQVTVVLYGNCGTTTGAFETLPSSSPQVCIYDGGTSITSISLSIVAPTTGKEVTPVCAADSDLTQCHNTSYAIPGIKAFTYVGTYTLPYYSRTWRFIYDGNNGGGSAAGRAATITNIVSPGSYETQLIDTLDNYAMVNSRQHNSSPELTVLPTPFFCTSTPNCYNPGAVDLFDTSYLSEPSGDSLYFQLIAATEGTTSCGTIGGPVTYTGTAWGSTPISPATPMNVVAGSWSFDPNTGQMCFTPSVTQRSIVVYNIDEYRQDTLGEIETFAGNGTSGYTGDGGAAVAARMAGPQGVCQDLAGDIFFADYANNAIRMINPVGLITTIAGTGTAGYCGDGGPAISATLNGPMGLTYDPPPHDNLIFADHNNHAVRYISNPASGGGLIYTAAGSGHPGYLGDGYNPISTLWDFAGPVGTATTAGYAGDGGSATAATTLLDQPAGICRDVTGNTYFCDYSNNVIRKITTAGVISTIAGSPAGTAGYAGDGGAASAALLNGPVGLAIDNTGNLYFADYNNNVVRKITTGGVISTIAGNPAGTAGYSGDGSLASATTAKLNRPTCVSLTGRADSIFIADHGNNVVRLVTTATGFIHTFAGSSAGTAGYSGDGGTSTSALFNGPFGLWTDTTLHLLYVSDQNNNRVRKINIATGASYMIVNNVAGNGTAGYGGDGGPASGPATELNSPAGLYKDVNGNLFIADYSNNLIRKVNNCNYISTIIGDGVNGESLDGTSAVAAKISGPSFITGDANFNIYITDRTGNHIRRYELSELNGPVGVAVDAAGANLYISEQGNNIIRKVTSYTSVTPIISTLAGSGTAGYVEGTGVAAKFNNPYGIYLRGTTLYVADESNNRVRTVNTGTGTTALISGAAAGFGGDGHLASSAAALYNSPTDVFVDATGNILIADHGNNRVREITTTGYLYTIAGAGTAGYFGDGGDPVAAWVNQPTFICKDAASNDVYISDFANNRVRIVYPDSLRTPELVGTMQREMTFLVLDCTTSAPQGGGVDSSAGTAHRIDSTHYLVCGNSGLMDLSFKSSEPGDTLNITITATGLPSGASFNVVSNNSPHPVATFEINTSTGSTNPGTYTFYVTFTDDHCPLQGTKTSAITITILPVPTIKDSLISSATCADKAVVLITPGGTGKPWTVKVSYPTSPFDTFQVFTNDSVAFYDTLAPGNDTVTIFTSAGTACNVGIPLIVPVPSHSVTGTFTNPTYCGAADGTIPIAGFGDLHNDTAIFRYNGVWQTGVPFLSSSTGTDTLTGLLAGTYDSIEVVEGNCVDSSHGLTLVLTNPPFMFRGVTARNATKCGFCNGIDTLFGLHPGQIDTVTYSLTGGASTQTASLVTSDSMMIISGLCAGSYNMIKVNTAGVCLDSSLAPTITQPGIIANFDTLFHFGCNGDTVFLNNLSSPASDLTYQWFFRDGGTSFLTNPTHVYANTIGQTYTILLTVTNTKCTTSDSATFTLNNFVKSGFSYTPVPYVCQGDPVSFANSSAGADPYTNALPTYVWYFGDGQTSVSTNPTHIYQNTGDFTITMVASNDVPCMDTSIQHIFIDSNSAIALLATDSVLCAGEAVTFAGQFSTIGDTTTTWGFGDNSGILNVNPVQHGYETPGSYVVSLDVKYRACPEKSMTRVIKVYASPSIYLGADQSICPGSNAITLIDQDNASNPLASWQWNTGETTSSISVVKPGSYYAVVTIDGCTASDTVQVSKDCYMEIPNVFTPNGDGTNDYFFPRQMLTKGVTSFKMDIYNRWGQQVYETTNTDGRGWDGTFNGTPQPEGVYVYMIDATYKDGQIEHHQGNITLLR